MSTPSTQKNLDQIRGAAALRLLPADGRHPFDRSDVACIPGLILSSGLLPAAAFCCEEGKEARRGMKAAFEGTAAYLKERGILTCQSTTGKALISDLVSKDALALQRATTEALAFLALLKRFARPKAP